MTAFALTSSSRANSLIRTWFTSDMLIKTLPLPAAPRRSCLPRIQPLLHFRFSPAIPVRPQRSARFLPPLRPRPPVLPLHLLPKPLRSLPRHWPLLQQRSVPRLPPARRCSLPLRLQQLRRRLRRSDSPPDKSCPPSSRRCPESPSTVPASSPPTSPHS